MVRRIVYLCVAVSLARASFAQFEGSITVSRMLLELRVTNYDGEPITTLTPDDFEVEVAGTPVRVASVVWNAEGAGATDAQTGDAPAEKRTVVVFIQTDFTRQPQRVTGQRSFTPYAEQIIRSFAADDRIAVFSFDSHLKFRSDLTTDRDAVAAAMRRAILIDKPSQPPAVDEPSLARFLDQESMKNARNTEEGLLIVANALKQIDGPKTLLLVGWGMGEHLRGIVDVKPAWHAARRALVDGRVTVIALNTGIGNQLSHGLRVAAEQTGGFYAHVKQLPQVIVKRVQRTLRGRYDLELIATRTLPAGMHPVSVRVKQRGAVVLAPQSIVISN
ncbi:MAG TPA: hypothetical protein VF846_19080 [Thermoanaerobaculia bacterium]|jgi:VWFA-related protein